MATIHPNDTWKEDKQPTLQKRSRGSILLLKKSVKDLFKKIMKHDSIQQLEPRRLVEVDKPKIQNIVNTSSSSSINRRSLLGTRKDMEVDRKKRHHSSARVEKSIC